MEHILTPILQLMFMDQFKVNRPGVGQIFIVSTLLIGGGLRLLWGNSRRAKENEAQ